MIVIKHSQFAMLISNVWVVMSFLAKPYDRIWMLMFGIAWLIGALFVWDYEKKKQREEDNASNAKVVEPGEHTKRFFIKNGIIVDRMERRVEDFDEVRS